jgi:hypothetical protein
MAHYRPCIFELSPFRGSLRFNLADAACEEALYLISASLKLQAMQEVR